MNPPTAPTPVAEISFSEYAASHAEPEAPEPAEAELAPVRDDKGRFVPKPKDESAAADPKSSDAGAKAPPEKADSPPADNGGDRAEVADDVPAGSPRAHLIQAVESGDPSAIDRAVKRLTGMSVEEFAAKCVPAMNVPSKRWAAFREQRNKAKQEVIAQREQLSAIASQLQTEYGPLVEAKKLYRAGRVADAVKKAFDDDYNTLQKKGLKEYHDRDPRIEELEERLAKYERDREERERQEQERVAKAEYDRQRSTWANQVHEGLKDSEDGTVALLASKRRFQGAVIDYIEQNAEALEGMSIEDILATAAEELTTNPPDELVDMIELAKAASDRGASLPATPTGPALPVRQGTQRKPARAPTTLKRSEAAEVKAPEQMPDGPERDAYIRAKFERALRQSVLE